MFGALNRFISRLDGEPQDERTNVQGAFGFQVLKNTNTDLALEPWFDFIIGINGHSTDSPDPNLFATEVRNCAGSNISLGIWSAKGQRIRETYVPIPADGSSLGLSLQWTPLTAADDVWHILDVTPNSPADIAGLLPYGDYVIGSPEGIMKGDSGLSELVEDYISRPLRLLVYNHEYNITRPVTITPSRNWGGQGALGCVLGFGALHHIPAPLEEPPHAPGETLFETPSDNTKQESYFPGNAPTTPIPATEATPTEFLVPANMQFAQAPPLASPSAGAHGRLKKARAHHAIASPGIDELFKEGEEKSRAQDYLPSRGSSVPPPPPPKSGAPPKMPPSTSPADK